jgi:predicted GNAT family N-acyltransferase
MANPLHEQWRHLKSRLGSLGLETGKDRSPQPRMTIVRTVDDLMRVQAIRAIVYMADQGCPYDEEYDGNDLCAMHVLGWQGDEPAACLRIRFFNNFAKLERLAVRPEFRQSPLAFKIVRYGLRLVARKGFPIAYGHAQEGREAFWARFGAKAIGTVGAFTFSGYRYTEMMVELPAARDALRIGVDPLILLRPEGVWDEPGVLERARTEGASPGEAESVTRNSGDGWSEATRAAWCQWAGITGT